MRVIDLELAYAAGLFEGEGATQIIRQSSSVCEEYFRLRVVVASTDDEIVEFFHERWNGSIYHSPTKEGHKPQKAWAAEGPRALEFLLDVRPFLRVDRIKKKAELGVIFQRQKTRSRLNRSSEYKETQRRFYDVMAALNKRGVAV